MVKAILRGLGDELRSGAHAWRMDALGCDLVSKEADFTEELSVRHVPLQECSRWAKSCGTGFSDDLIGFQLDADMAEVLSPTCAPKTQTWS